MSNNTAQVGDTIKCNDKDEMLQVMTNLAKQGIFTDFMYEKDGMKGYWLVVERIKDANRSN